LLVRWDLPSFVVAHGVAGLALAAAADTDTVVITDSLVALVALAVAVVLKRWPWAAAAAVLMLLVGVDAGSGWLALVLLVEGCALTVTGLLQTRETRSILLVLGAGSLIGAWFDLTAWQSWADSTIFYTTVWGGAAVGLLAAIGLRQPRIPRELAGAWAVVGPTVMLAAIGFGNDAARLPGGLTVAGALMLLALAAAVLVPVLGSEMRWVASGMGAVAWLPVAYALEPSQTSAVLVATGVALAAFTAAVAVHGRRPAATWLAPGTLYAALVQAGAAIVALAALPDDELVIVVLLAVSAELVALGVLADRPEVMVLSPIAACGAWLLYARHALTGNANWFTVPVGFALLVVVALIRWIRAVRGGDRSGLDVVVLELVGMSFLVASPMALTLAGRLWNGVLMVGIGCMIAAWGGVTRVRWRAGFGAVATVIATLLLIGVPLSRSVTWEGPILWVALSAAGIAAIAVASVLERSRDQARQIGRRLSQMTAGWERFSSGGPSPVQESSDQHQPVA
jgi:hypothetical protein